MTDPVQQSMFHTAPNLPRGFTYRPDFITGAEQARLLDDIRQLPLQEAAYRQWTAKRRIISYGGRYDFSHQRLDPAGPVPAFLQPLRDEMASWAGVPREEFSHATIAEYRQGTPLGWHRDVPDFELVAGVSLAGTARVRFRPYPHVIGSKARATVTLDLLPRSAYIIRDDARWQWQHAISPTPELRYSITFRTLNSTKR